MNPRLLSIIAIVALLVMPDDGGSILSDSPCPGQGSHVLILEKRDDRENLRKRSGYEDQLSAMLSVPAEPGRHYLYDVGQKLDEKCAEDPWVCQAMEVAMRDSKGQLPWIVIDHDGHGTSQAMPRNKSELDALRSRF